MISIRGKASVSFERSGQIDACQVAGRGERHGSSSASGQRTAIVLGDRRIVAQLIGYRNVRSSLSTKVLQRNGYRLIIGVVVVLRYRSRDGHNTHIVLRDRGVDGNRCSRRFASVVHLELRVHTIVGDGEARLTRQRRILSLGQHFLAVACHLRVRELRCGADTIGGHAACITAIVFRIQEETLASIVETSVHWESDPTYLVKHKLAIVHKRCRGGLVHPVHLRSTGTNILSIGSILQPELHRDSHTIVICRADLQIDTVDTTFRATHILLVVENLSVRVTVGKRERSSIRL